MKTQKKVDQEKLNDFFQEVDKNKKNNSNDKNDSEFDTINGPVSKPYQCPMCHKSLSSRKEPCKYCGYKGYIPMGDDEIKKTRIILFVVILIIALVILMITRNKL